LLKVYENIQKASIVVGKEPEEIILVAVSKTFPSEYIKIVYELGQRVFGENRLKDAVNKIQELRYLENIKFHMIGHIQSNKVRYIKDNFALVESVDRTEIADAIGKNSKEINYIQDILIQVNLVGEEQKTGVSPEDLYRLIDYIAQTRRLNLKGLMFIPPFTRDPEDNRMNFRNMSKLFTICQNKYSNIDNVSFDYLSMGMSADYQIAIEEGSNMVRVGTKIFGSRN